MASDAATRQVDCIGSRLKRVELVLLDKGLTESMGM